MNEEDRKEYKRATLAEAIDVARKAGVKKDLICLHISSRYENKVRVIAAASGRCEGLDFKVTPSACIHCVVAALTPCSTHSY